MHYNEKIEALIEQNGSSMRKGLIEFAVMTITCQRPVYVGQIIDQLRASGMNIVEGTLYPLLSRLNKSGQVEYQWKESKSGPPRKYYTLTKEGEQVLAEYHNQWKQLKKAITKLEKGIE